MPLFYIAKIERWQSYHPAKDVIHLENAPVKSSATILKRVREEWRPERDNNNEVTTGVDSIAFLALTSSCPCGGYGCLDSEVSATSNLPALALPKLPLLDNMRICNGWEFNFAAKVEISRRTQVRKLKFLSDLGLVETETLAAASSSSYVFILLIRIKADIRLLQRFARGVGLCMNRHFA